MARQNPELGRRQALDKLLAMFTVRSFRDNGEAAHIVDALIAGQTLERACSARFVPNAFMLNNSVSRQVLMRVVASALGDATIQPDPATDLRGHLVSKQKITINNFGNFGGVVGGGTVKSVHQSQYSRKQIPRLATEQRTDPRVRQILEESASLPEKRSRLTAFLEGTRGIATDLAAKIATNLLTETPGS